MQMQPFGSTNLVSWQLVDLQSNRPPSVATRAEQRPLDGAEQRSLTISTDQPGRFDFGMMRALRAPCPERVPFAQVAKGHVEAGEDAAVDDRLRRNLHLARRDDLFHNVTAVVVDQQHPWAATDRGLLSCLANHRVGRSAYGFEMRLLLSIPHFDSEVIFGRFHHQRRPLCHPRE